MKPLLPLLFLFLLVSGAVYYLRTQSHSLQPIHTSSKPLATETAKATQRLHHFASRAQTVARQKGFSTRYQFFIDMTLHSGRKRFFVWDAHNGSVKDTGLVAHGSCRTAYLQTVRFSNVPECGCSSVGYYRVGGSYQGRFGKSFKLHGLDSTNSNAFRRAVVLHPYGCVPDDEVYPQSICNSLGCPMVSHAFMERLTALIEGEKRPILLWLYN